MNRKQINVIYHPSLLNLEVFKPSFESLFCSDTSEVVNNDNVLLKRLAQILSICGVSLILYASISHYIAEKQSVFLIKQANSSYNENQPSTQTTNAPSTNKISPSVIASYSVNPSYPKYLNISKLSVHSRVLPLGVNKSGALATPENINDTGWYVKSSAPGQQGAMLIDGHVSSWTSHGVFFGIKNLVNGYNIQIVRGDNKVFNYKVVSTKFYNANNVDMTTALSSTLPNTPGLNLITCAGDVIPGTSEFNQRVVVFAIQD